jgi:hypothetical protein
MMLTVSLLLAPTGFVMAQAPVPAADRQIAAAVLPVPAEMRAGATVWGYSPDGKFVSLRQGTNEMICLASNPGAPSFHVACYHQSLEPFMARGRELRTQGVQGAAVDTARFAEVKSGKLKVPTQPAMLYSLTGGTYDPATNTATGARHLFVTYIPFATPASTGLSAKPSGAMPWIMNPGTPKAHIMFTPGM